MTSNLFKETKIEETVKEIDLPLFNTDEIKFLKKGKIRGIIVYEDESFSEFYFKLKKGYVINIKNRYYQVIPKCIVRGKYPTIMWYFNNPAPIHLKYEEAKLKGKDFYNEKEIKMMTDEEQSILANTTIDADALKAMMDSNVLQGMYAKPSVTPRTLIMVLIIIGVIVLVVLQLTGQIDIFGALAGKK